MTLTKEIVPSQAVKSECNERPEEIDKESEGYQHILQTVENSGISNKPIARMEDGQIAIVDGWHRVKAAEEAGLDKITVNLEEDMGDVEAMKKSLYGNMNEAQEDVTPQDRALHLLKLSENLGIGDDPSASKLSDELGVSRSTVQRWIERLRDDWKDTLIDPTKENKHVHSEHLKEISDRKLSSIRKTTDDGDDGEWLVLQTIENSLTTRDLSQVREYTENGVELEDAVKVVTEELSEDEISFESDEEQEQEVTTAPTPESPTEPTVDKSSEAERKTSTAELSSSEGSWTDSLESTDDTQEGGDGNDSWATVEDDDTVEEETVEEAEPIEDTQEEDSEREPWPPENADELSEQYRGWSDVKDDIEESEKNEDGGMEITISLSKMETEAVEDAMDCNYPDPETLLRDALQFYLHQGKWME